MHVQDPRVEAVLHRLDNLETRSGTVESRLDVMDTNVEALGTSMSSQFSQVLASLASFTEMQKENTANGKRRALEPFAPPS